MKKSVDYITSKYTDKNFKPEIGMILGSGLGEIADEIQGTRIPYSEIEGFMASSVEGHTGNLVIGTLNGKKVIAMQGRIHYYEGHTMEKVVYPLRIMKLLGIDKLIVTNACGGVNESFKPGDLMIINDHINMLGTNPLIGKNYSDLGSRFIDMTQAYNKNLIKLAEKTAEELKIDYQKGVYAAMTGPSYETPAEVRMLRMLGADAVGMSTVPEVITANHMNINVLGISCITNMAAGILDKPLSHEEVIKTSQKVKEEFKSLVKNILKQI